MYPSYWIRLGIESIFPSYSHQWPHCDLIGIIVSRGNHPPSWPYFRFVKYWNIHVCISCLYIIIWSYTYNIYIYAYTPKTSHVPLVSTRGEASAHLLPKWGAVPRGPVGVFPARLDAEVGKIQGKWTGCRMFPFIGILLLYRLFYNVYCFSIMTGNNDNDCSIMVIVTMIVITEQ